MTAPAPPSIFDQLVALIDSSREFLAIGLGALGSFLAMRHRDRRNDLALEKKIELDHAAQRYMLSPREKALQEAFDRANQERINYLMDECEERDSRISNLENEIRRLNDENRALWQKAVQYKTALSGLEDDEPTGFQRPVEKT